MIIKRNFFLFSVLLIIILSFAIYSNSFNAAFQFDDGVHIVKQNSINDLDHFSKLSSWTNINDRPLVFFSLSLNHSIHGLNVFGYHLYNLIIHIFAGIFVYLISLLLFKNQSVNASFVKGNEHIMALFVALIFIAHPIQTQSVTYVIQRMTSMASLFYLGAIYFYLYARFEYVNNGFGSKILLSYLFTFLCAIASILSKQIAATIPLAILITEFFFIRNSEGKIFKKYVLSLGMILLTIAIVIISAALLPKETASISRIDYLITQFRVIVKYFQLLIFPISQNLDYDFSISHSFWGVKEMLSFLFNAALLFFAVRLFKNYRFISFGIFWVFISLLIESSVIPIQDVIFEHRLYLPMFGFALILVSLSFRFIKSKKAIYPIIFLICIVLIYAFKSYSRNEIWQTKLSLWTDVVKKSPNKVRPHLNLGNTYFHLKNHQLALRHFNKAIDIDPSNWLGYFNRAQVALYLNNPNVAINDLNQSIRYKNDFADSYDARGVSKIQIQDIQGAISDFSRAINLEADLASAWFNRANAKIYLKDVKGALSDYNKAIQLNTEFSEAYNNRGQLKLNLKQFDEAIDDLNNAVKINPNFIEAYNNRAKANMSQNFLDAAIADLTKSLLLDKRSALIYRYRAMCFFRQSDYKRAYDDFLRAAQLGDTIAPQFSKELELKLQNEKNR